MKSFFSFLLLCLFGFGLMAQSDSSSIRKPQPRIYTHYDSVHLAKLNSSGNLMIAGGLGLCIAGSYLFYEAHKVYGTAPSAGSTNPSEETTRNHRQGTIYYVAGGVGAAAGILLTAFGARNKVDFKRQKRMMEMQGGLLDNGHLGLALNF
jgi:hypothetical protein